MQEPRRPIDAQLLRRILRAIGEPPDRIYAPSEDSYLILEGIAGVPLEERGVLDMGTGSGILGLFCATKGARVTVADVDELAIRHALKAAKEMGLRLDARQSDLFSNVNGQFDLVLFNPPYLPSKTVEDRAVDGGASGRALINRFLLELPNHLKADGAAFLLVSSLNDPSSIPREHPRFQFSQVAKRSLFFEELQLLCVRFRDNFPG